MSVWSDTSTVTCPACGNQQSETMPGSLWELECTHCGHRMHPPKGGCCVFCAYGDWPCPDQQIAGSCSCGSEWG